MSENLSKVNNEMENEKVGKLILKYALPCITAMVVSALYNIVDQIFIGQGVGYIGNAATNVGFPLIVLSQGIALLFGDGAAALYSIKLGEKNIKEAEKIISNAIIMIIAISVVFFVVSSLFLEKFLWLFGATNSNISYALDYMTIVNISIPFNIITCGLSSIIRADGSPEFCMKSLILGTILNCILDPVFIFVFHMGIKGAAIATLIGEVVSCLINLGYLFKFKNIKLQRKNFTINCEILKKIFLFGLPTFIIQLAVTLIVVVSNNMIVKYGAMSKYGSDIPLSSIGIVMKINDILIGIIIGLGAGGQPIIGYNYGCGNLNRVKETYFKLIKTGTVISVIAFIMFHFFPDAIINLFGKNDALYNEFAIKSFKIFLMLCIFTGFELITISFFQSIGKPLKSIILSLCKQTFFIIPLMIVLPRFLGVEGVLYAGPCTEMLSVIVSFILIKHEFAQFKKILDSPVM